MKILNLAAAALIDSVSRNNIDPKLLLEGTELKLEVLQKTNKKHTWAQFVIMYENCAKLLGPQKAVQEIAHSGIFNKELTTTRKLATSFFDAKSIYWYLSQFASRKLFKGAVTFKYKKINANHISMDLAINPDLEDCPLLLETYFYLFEKIPTLLCLPKAKVELEYFDRRALYNVHLAQSSYLKVFLRSLGRVMDGHNSSVTLLGEMENQSVELSKMVEVKSQLIKILSHDIANQSFTIDLYLQQVLKSQGLTDEDRKYLENAKISSQKLCNILKNVQALEKFDIKGVDLAAVNLDKIFSSLKKQFRYQVDLKNLNLTFKNNLPVTLTAIAEEISLEDSVLTNLISNAIKFSHPGSAINVEANIYNGRVQISVSDQGIGMSAEDRNNLFSNQMLKSSAGTKGETGTGFGLNIVKTYVNLYEGKIFVHSNIPAGTIFIIELTATEV